MPAFRHAGAARTRVAMLTLAAATFAAATACSGGSNGSTADAPTAPATTSTPAAASTPAVPASPSSSPTAKTSAGDGALGRCHTDDLTAKTGGNNAAMGSAGTRLTLTNTSERACTVYGYVGLLRLNHARQPVATTLRRGRSMIFRDPGARLVTLAPGGTASAGIGWGDDPAGNETARSCRDSIYLEVTPPDETTHLVIRTHPISACGGDLWVTAMQPGSKPAGP